MYHFYTRDTAPRNIGENLIIYQLAISENSSNQSKTLYGILSILKCTNSITTNYSSRC